MLRIWDGGLAIYGGILMSVLVSYLFCKRRGIRVMAVWDLGSIGLLIGQSVGRWGNFVNMEAYGGETDLLWRMGVYGWENGVQRYMEVHPTFLYESIWNLIGFLMIIFVLSRKRCFDGQIFFHYIAWYGLGRAWIEGLRSDSLYFFGSGLRVSQCLAILSCLGAVIWLAIQYRRPHTSEDLWVNTAQCKRRVGEKGVRMERENGST